MLSRMNRRIDAIAARYQRLSGWRRALWALGAYLLLFCLLTLLGRLFLLLGRRSIVWQYDSSGEYYPATVYFVGAVRDFLAGRAVPAFDLSIGLGADALSSLNFYGYGDPLLFLLALTPIRDMEVLFTLGVSLRQALCGLFFYLYVRRMGVRRSYGVLGALAYGFCAFVNCNTLFHQNFLNGALYLPLVLLGYERFAGERKPGVLIFAAALTALTSFYFLYIISLFLLVYAIFRFFATHPRGKRKGAFAPLAGGAALCYGAGVLLAGVVLLPCVYGYLHSARVPQPLALNLWVYPLDEWLGRLSHYAFPLGYQFETVAIWALWAALLPAVSSSVRKRMGLSVWALVLALVYLVSPLIPFALNGFSYISNRSVFLLSFLFCWAMTVMAKPMLRLGRKEKWTLSLALLVLYLLFAYSLITGKDLVGKRAYYLYIVGFGGVAALAVAALWRFNRPDARALRWAPLMAAFVMVVGNLGINALLYGYWRYQGGQLLKAGKVDATIQNTPAASALALGDESFYRIEVPYGDLTVRNESILMGFNPTSCYLSIQNENNLQPLSQMELSSRVALHYITGLEGRPELMALMGVKYFCATTDSPQAPPYGFELVREDGKSKVYQNRYASGLGYSFDGYIPLESYQALDALGKQQALMQGAVLEKEPTGLNIAQAPLRDSRVEVPCRVERADGVSLNDGILDVQRDGATMTLAFETPPGCESYLRFDHFDVDDAPYEIASIEVWGEGFVRQVYLCSNQRYKYNYGLYDRTVDMGWREGSLRSVTLRFEKAGKARLKGIQVFCLPMEGYESDARSLGEQAMTQVVMGTDRIEGVVEFEQDRVLVLAIPYSEGWHAQVDGQATPIDRGSGLTMQLALSAGRHQVALLYRRPWQAAGLAASALGGAASILLCAWFARKRRRQKHM